MSERRRRKYRKVSPETWAIIRKAYLEGFTAVALARRYGLYPGAIYHKACYEGWMEGVPPRPIGRAARRDVGALPDAPPDLGADALPDPVEPEDAPPSETGRPGPWIDPDRWAASAVEGAAALMMEGRFQEARTYLKLADISVRAAPAPAPATRVRYPTAKELWPQIRIVAACMLGNFPGTPYTYSRAVAQWRRDTLGEDASREDRDKARFGGWYESVFEPDGSVRPPFED